MRIGMDPHKEYRQIVLPPGTSNAGGYCRSSKSGVFLCPRAISMIAHKCSLDGISKNSAYLRINNPEYSL